MITLSSSRRERVAERRLSWPDEWRCSSGAGIHPKYIAAITFTEAAAAELLERVESIVEALRSGEIPIELAEALPTGLTEAQRVNLQNGAEALDEITCTTIHGFCQQLIRPYPVETGLDPGAAIIDPAAAELAYQDLMEAWLSARFGRDRGAEGLGRIPPIEDAGNEEDFFAELLLKMPDANTGTDKAYGAISEGPPDGASSWFGN